MSNFGEYLSRTRMEKGLSQQDLADALWDNPSGDISTGERQADSDAQDREATC